MAVKWDPILEGEELHADRVEDIGQAVVNQINSIGANQISESGLNWENFESNAVVIQWKQNIQTDYRTLQGMVIPSISGTTWMGNPLTNELAPMRDPAWDLSTTPTGDQLTISPPVGWERVHNLTLDSDIDLESDNGNGLLVLGESYAYTIANPAGTTDQPNPHHILFTIIVVKVMDGSGNPLFVPIPTTLRWVGGDTNTNNSTWTDSPWVASGYGTTGSGHYCSQKNWVRKNMPVRTLITYDDVHAQTHAGNSEDSTDVDDFKRIRAVYIYACVKNCSRSAPAGGTQAQIRERVLTAIEFRAKVASRTKATAISYP